MQRSELLVLIRLLREINKNTVQITSLLTEVLSREAQPHRRLHRRLTVTILKK